VEVPQVKSPPGAEELACAITVQVTIDNGRMIVMQTYIGRDDPVGAYHDMLDKLGEAVDRQQAKYQLDGLKANLELHVTTLKNMEEDFNGIEARAEKAWAASQRKGPVKMSPNEIAQKGTAKTNIERYRQKIVELKLDIAACEAKIHPVD